MNKSSEDVGKKKCGIIMPISADNNSIKYSKKHWKDVCQMIKESISKTEFEASPVWEDTVWKECGSDIIKSTILENIVSHDIIVCDISSLNANVLFELGLRISLRKPVVIICDDNTIPPFHINDIRYVDQYPIGLCYIDIPDFQKKLADTITKTWNKAMDDGEKYTQLSQLSSIKKFSIIDENREEVPYSEAISKILKAIKEMKKNYDEDNMKSSTFTRIIGEITSNILTVQDGKNELLKFMKSFSNNIKKANLNMEDIKEYVDELNAKMTSFIDFSEDLILSVEYYFNDHNK